MSDLMIQKEALREVEGLKLDQHEHERAYFSQPLFGSKWTCNEGNVKTYEVCKVLANYTAKSWHDLSYVAYRVWNAVKAIFNRSDWQKIVSFVVQESPIATIKVLGAAVHETIEEDLILALNLNWENEEAIKIEAKDCEQKNIVLQ